MPNSPIKIIQCDDDGNEIRIFDSASEAAKSFGNPTPNWIRKAARNGTKAFGYRWKYFGKDLVIKSEGTPGKRRSIIATKEGESLSFPSISEASRELRIGISSIEDALMTGGLRKGYRFRHADQDPKPKATRFTKPLVGIDDSGVIKMEFPSVREAAMSLGVIPAAIYGCLRPGNERCRCKGLRWRYKQNLE